MTGICFESKLEMRFFLLLNIWKFSVSTFNLRKNSRLDFIVEPFEEEIPNNFQTFSKNRRFEDILRRTSNKIP